MWTCSKCGRIFEKENQPHSCKIIPLEEHFKNKDKAKELFDYVLDKVNSEVGKCKIISLPCCVHLFGKYDFFAILPKKDGLEIRFALDRQLKSPRITQVVPMSSKTFKNCLQINSKADIDLEFIRWLKQAYFLKG